MRYSFPSFIFSQFVIGFTWQGANHIAKCKVNFAGYLTTFLSCTKILQTFQNLVYMYGWFDVVDGGYSQFQKIIALALVITDKMIIFESR